MDNFSSDDAPDRYQEFVMNKNTQKSIGWAFLLIVFGIIALMEGTKSLLLLIPAAMMIWYGARPTVNNGRN
jgi:hypothetical protein